MLVLTACLSTALAQTQRPKFNFINPESVPIKSLLGDPPAMDSPKVKAELAEVLKVQEKRTMTEVARVTSEIKLDPFLFQEPIGLWFQRNSLPETTKLLRAILTDCSNVSETGKMAWGRPHPFMIDSRVHPCVSPLPTDYCYPSSHANAATVLGKVLSDLVPDRKKEIMARADQVGEDRLIAGLHYPSDVEAGRKLGAYLYTCLQTNILFQTNFAKAKAEVSAFIVKNGSTSPAPK